MTLPVPPLSTVYGLLSAACGQDVDPERVWVAYRFQAEAQAEDLEKIVKFSERGPEWDAKMAQVGSMPIRRQFLVNAVLDLYVPAEEPLLHALRSPRYPLVLGRSQDVAYVERLGRVVLEPCQDGEVQGVLLPFPSPGVRSLVYSLPTYLPTHPPRRPLSVKPFQLVEHRQRVRHALLHRASDSELLVPLYTGEQLR